MKTAAATKRRPVEGNRIRVQDPRVKGGSYWRRLPGNGRLRQEEAVTAPRHAAAAQSGRGRLLVGAALLLGGAIAGGAVGSLATHWGSQQQVGQKIAAAQKSAAAQVAKEKQALGEHSAQELEHRTQEIQQKANQEAMAQVIAERESAMQAAQAEILAATQPKARKAGDLVDDDQVGIALGASVRQGLDLNTVSEANQQRRVTEAVRRLVGRRYEQGLQDLAIDFRDRTKEIQKLGGERVPQSQKEMDTQTRIRWEAMERAMMRQSQREGLLTEELDRVRRSTTADYMKAFSELQTLAKAQGDYHPELIKAFDQKSQKINKALQREIGRVASSVRQTIRLDARARSQAYYAAIAATMMRTDVLPAPAPAPAPAPRLPDENRQRLEGSIRQLIATSYQKPITAILSFQVDDSDVLGGQFQSGDDLYQFSISKDGRLSYGLVEPKTDAYWEAYDAVRRDAPTLAPVRSQGVGEKDHCVEGISCGTTCLPRTKKCEIGLPPQAKQAAPAIINAAKAISQPQTQPPAAAPEQAAATSPKKSVFQKAKALALTDVRDLLPGKKKKGAGLSLADVQQLPPEMQKSLLKGGSLPTDQLAKELGIPEKQVKAILQEGALTQENVSYLQGEYKQKVANPSQEDQKPKEGSPAAAGQPSEGSPPPVRRGGKKAPGLKKQLKLGSTTASLLAENHRLKDFKGFEEFRDVSVQTVDFKINGSYDAGSVTDRKQGVQSAREIKKEMESHFASLPEGQLVFNRPYSKDGNGKARIKHYQKAGFGEGDEYGRMWAVIQNGKPTPLKPGELHSYLRQKS